jgi:hypothetical protein
VINRQIMGKAGRSEIGQVFMRFTIGEGVGVKNGIQSFMSASSEADLNRLSIHVRLPSTADIHHAIVTSAAFPMPDVRQKESVPN